MAAGFHMLAGPVPPAWLANSDFANYWIGARLALTGQIDLVFGPHEGYFAEMRATFGEDSPWRAWSYPPHYLLLLLPVGVPGYAAALGAFVTFTGGLYLLVFRLYAWQDGSRWEPRVLVLLLPFLLANGLAGQNGFATGFLMLAGLALRERRPVLAGVAFGALTIKPHLGLLLPILLLAERRWSVILSAIATAAGVVLTSGLVLGWGSWVGFFENVVPYQRSVTEHGTGVFLAMMPSPFGSLRSLGIAGDAAMAAHLGLAVPVAVLASLVFFKAAEPRLRDAALVTATVLVTPYGFVYDLGAFAALAAILWMRTPGLLTGNIRAVVLTLALLVPILTLLLGLLRLPVASAVLVAVFVILFKDAYGASQRE